LKGFQRVTLAPQERRTVRFTLSDKDLTYYSGAKHAWVIDPADFDLYAGDNADAALHGSFTRTE
jgi:beta-glucosidase